MLKRREKILKRIYILVELIEKNDSDDYVQELTILLRELSELSISVDKINTLFSIFLPIMLVINKNEELCNIVLKLKEKQIYLNSKTRIENGILKEFPISKIIEVPRNVKTVCGWREDSENKDIMFYNCFEGNENIERVICPNTVEIIGEKAFMHCINLEEVEIIKTGNQHLKTIGLCAFSSCTKLKKINLPNTLERIDEFAFSSIPNLTIYFDGTKEEWDKINKKEKWNQDSHINIIFEKKKEEFLKFKNRMERLHRYCSFNIELVKKSAKCHCFYCKSSFDASETLKEGAEILDDGQTVVCPICGIDSVLPDAISEPINEEVISEMHNYWF